MKYRTNALRDDNQLMKPSMNPPCSPRVSQSMPVAPQQLRSDADVRSPTGPLISPNPNQPFPRKSMEYETTWKDLPLHEDVATVTKPEAAARTWPSTESKREKSEVATKDSPKNHHEASSSSVPGSPQHLVSPIGDTTAPDLTQTGRDSPVSPLEKASIAHHEHLTNGSTNNPIQDPENADKAYSKTDAAAPATTVKRAETPSELHALGAIAKDPKPAADEAKESKLVDHKPEDTGAAA